MEGSPAHFEAKLVPIGDSKLRVNWLKNGKPIQCSNKMSTLNDFGFVALDLKYTRTDDSGAYTCNAINELGEANITANLKVWTNKISIMWQSYLCFIYRNSCNYTCSETNLKFIYSENATNFYEIFTLLLSYVVLVKNKVKSLQNFVAFSEYINFNEKNIFSLCFQISLGFWRCVEKWLDSLHFSGSLVISYLSNMLSGCWIGFGSLPLRL